MHFKRFFSTFSGLKEKLTRFFSHFSIEKRDLDALPVISERTCIAEIVLHYPEFENFLKEEFQITLAHSAHSLSLHRFTQNFPVPPPQVLFMEFQLRKRSPVRRVTPATLKTWMEKEAKAVILDARENWEREWGTLPRSRPLDAALLEDAIRNWPKDTPLAVYCHFGVRSLDAAIYLADQGFQDVRTLSGGVEAWSLQVDPNFPRYPGHPC